MLPDNEIWTAEEVARYLRISERHVRRMATLRELPGAFRIGTHWRFHADAIRGYVRERVTV